MVSRRVLLKQLAVVSAGVALSQSFVGCSSKPSTLFKKVAITEDQEGLLKLIAETIIPKTSTPGATDTKVIEYTAKMIDDCLSKADQEKWLKGLGLFNEAADKNGFANNNTADQIKFLTEFNESKEETDINFFFKTTKRYTLRGFTSSEYFMTNVQGYKIIPGKYKGCVPVTAA